MTQRSGLVNRSLIPVILLSTALAGCIAGGQSRDAAVEAAASKQGSDHPAVVRPGAPGEATIIYENAGDIDLVRPQYTEADVRFMQGMIHHHAQALVMAALVPDRSNRRDLYMLAKRIEVAQKDEIRLMQDWLERRGEEKPHVDFSTGEVQDVGGEHAGHAAGQGVHSGPMMPGMLTADQMEQLRTTEGSEFYRLWITYMIQHHEGALGMVADLFSQDGAAQDQDIFRFASEVDIDQRVEIVRMQQMLAASR